MGFSPGGPAGGPNPFPKGFLSSLGSAKKMMIIIFDSTTSTFSWLEAINRKIALSMQMDRAERDSKLVFNILLL